MRPRRPVLGLAGHLGSRVSDLVDGRLGADEEERAWAHVHGCEGCRRLVEIESWTKTRLRSFSRYDDPETPPLSLSPDRLAWAQVHEVERASVRRRVAIAAVGAGSVGAAVIGIVAATGATAGGGVAPGSPSPAMVRAQFGGAQPGRMQRRIHPDPIIFARRTTR